MQILYIIVAEPADYGKLFPTGPSAVTSREFQISAIRIFEHVALTNAALAGIPLAKVHNIVRSLQEGLIGIETASREEYTDEDINHKDMLENTLVFLLKDGTDLSLFENTPDKTGVTAILYPETAEGEHPIITPVICRVMPNPSAHN